MKDYINILVANNAVFLRKKKVGDKVSRFTRIFDEDKCIEFDVVYDDTEKGYMEQFIIEAEKQEKEHFKKGPFEIHCKLREQLNNICTEFKKLCA